MIDRAKRGGGFVPSTSAGERAAGRGRDPSPEIWRARLTAMGRMRAVRDARPMDARRQRRLFGDEVEKVAGES